MPRNDHRLWQDTVELPHFPRLTQDAQTDVLILGGGLAGVLCAWRLHRAGIPCLLCEGETVGCGTTGGTTAVVSAQHDTLYADLIKQKGEAAARGYLEANLEAVEEYAALAREYDFDFERAPSYMYARQDGAWMDRELAALERLGYHARKVEKVPLPFSTAGAVCFPNQGQMHPLKLLRALLPGLNIAEHTRIDRVEGTTAFFGEHKIQAKKILVATHFPIVNTHGFYFAKLYQRRSYVIALEHPGVLAGTYVGRGAEDFYFRRYGKLLLVGGGEHRTGQRGGSFQVLRRFAKEYVPEAPERYAWATQDCMSLDGVPYIGPYSPELPNVFVASGFNEWGMTTSMVASRLLCDLVQGKENPLSQVFSPSRSVLHPQLFRNLGATALHLLKPTPKRCPHLGCALQWNPVEHTWDCPCHGSRFDEGGKLLNNPATGDLKGRITGCCSQSDSKTGR